MDKDVICMDVPLFIRLLEECREGIESDAELHFLVEQVLEESKVSDGAPLTMDNYAGIMDYKNKYIIYQDELTTKEDEEDDE